MSKTVFIPKNPNIDSVTTAWIFCYENGRSQSDIELVPATWDGSEMSDSDVCIGLNAPKAHDRQSYRYGPNADKRMISCLSNYISNYKGTSNLDFLSSLSGYIDNSLTNRGAWAKSLAKGGDFNPYLVDIACVFDSYKHRAREVAPDDEDTYLIDFWFDLLDGYRGKQENTNKARDLSEKVEMTNVEGVSIACVEDTEGVSAQDISRFLFSKGANVIIYQEGNHVGVLRSRRASFPDLTVLRNHIDEDGWYFYPKGTMASRGSRSKPIEGDSIYSLKDLLEKVTLVVRESQVPA